MPPRLSQTCSVIVSFASSGQGSAALTASTSPPTTNTTSKTSERSENLVSRSSRFSWWTTVLKNLNGNTGITSLFRLLREILPTQRCQLYWLTCAPSACSEITEPSKSVIGE